MKISIVIPAFNESGKISSDIETACQFLKRNDLEGEVIVVDDGSTDGTLQEAETAGRNSPAGVEVKTLSNPHSGKGHAVRSGMKQTTGDYVMFADSGNCIPYENILRGLEMITTGQCDIAHGSRNLVGADIKKDHGLYRHICSEFFHWFVISIMKAPAELTDTQCGFKIYRGGTARHLFGECITDGFMFDIEIILRAMKEGYKIKEFPVYWTCDTDSRLTPAKNARKILAELIKIRAALRTKE